jgi:hypothetical protein
VLPLRYRGPKIDPAQAMVKRKSSRGWRRKAGVGHGHQAATGETSAHYCRGKRCDPRTIRSAADLPGSMRCWMPSRPAINIAENARYPLQEGSGERNSTLFARGFDEYIGIRQQAERLRCE